MQCADWATKSVAVFVDTFSSTGHIRLTQLSLSAWFCRCFTDLSPEPADLVSAEFLWAALDCPGAFAFPEPAQGAVLLGELQVALLGDVSVDERCVLVAYEVAHHGRKHHTATALFGEAGACLGLGLGIWFEVDQALAKGDV